MPITPLQIANIALARIGVKNFMDAEEDGSPEAAVFEVVYEPLRDALLERHEWGFAKKEQALAQLAGVTRSGWDYAFALPVDCIAARRIFQGLRLPPEESRIAFEVQASDALDGRILVCDEPAPTLIYTARVTNADAFPRLFTDALVWGLAKEFALAIPGKLNMLSTLEQRYEMAISTAKGASLREGQQDVPPEGSSIRARS